LEESLLKVIEFDIFLTLFWFLFFFAKKGGEARKSIEVSRHYNILDFILNVIYVFEDNWISFLFFLFWRFLLLKN